MRGRMERGYEGAYGEDMRGRMERAYVCVGAHLM